MIKTKNGKLAKYEFVEKYNLIYRYQKMNR